LETGCEERLQEAFLHGIPHNVLNAKHHEKEAEIIAEAGRAGAVTIATNMAGRGVDILLGGRKTAEGEDRAAEAKEVISLGGLAILGSERHESRRIDNQLRGRAGRQGDPGMSRFYVSMSDELMRLFGDKSQSLMFNLWPEEQPVEAKLVSRSIEKAQKKVEAHNFEIRKDVLRYDDVMNLQRNIIYTERKKILQGVDLQANVKSFINEIVDSAVKGYCPEGVRPEEWDVDSLYHLLNQTMPLEFILKPEELVGKGREELREMLKGAGSKLLEQREKSLPPEVVPDLYRWALLTTIDSRWIEHLESMDYLREGIGLRGYAQVDPIIPYANEAYEMFQHTLQSIREEVVSLIFRAQIVQRPQQQAASVYHEVEQAMESIDGRAAPIRVGHKIGRNDPCPCGSGQKYKKCCMLKETVN
jgi:preprotein translocase subunit SecA